MVPQWDEMYEAIGNATTATGTVESEDGTADVGAFARHNFKRSQGMVSTERDRATNTTMTSDPCGSIGNGNVQAVVGSVGIWDSCVPARLLEPAAIWSEKPSNGEMQPMTTFFTTNCINSWVERATQMEILHTPTTSQRKPYKLRLPNVCHHTEYRRERTGCQQHPTKHKFSL